MRSKTVKQVRKQGLRLKRWRDQFPWFLTGPHGFQCRVCRDAQVESVWARGESNLFKIRVVTQTVNQLIDWFVDWLTDRLQIPSQSKAAGVLSISLLPIYGNMLNVRLIALLCPACIHQHSTRQQDVSTCNATVNFTVDLQVLKLSGQADCDSRALEVELSQDPGCLFCQSNQLGKFETNKDVRRPFAVGRSSLIPWCLRGWSMLSRKRKSTRLCLELIYVKQT